MDTMVAFSLFSRVPFPVRLHRSIQILRTEQGSTCQRVYNEGRRFHCKGIYELSGIASDRVSVVYL